MDLEEKPRPPPQVPSGTPADRSAKSDLPDEYPMTKVSKYSFVDSSPDVKTKKMMRTKKTTKKPAHQARTKMKAPGSEGEAQIAIEETKSAKLNTRKKGDRKQSKIDVPKVEQDGWLHSATPKIESTMQM